MKNVNLNERADYEWIEAFAEKGFARAEQLGGEIVVMGAASRERSPIV